MRITYIGHATLLIEISGHRLLTDPNFDPKLARFLRRVAAPGIPLEQIGDLDAVLVTHVHADHLSIDSLRALPRTQLLVPGTAAPWLRRMGFHHAEAVRPGEERQIGRLKVITHAARHVGSRYGYDRWRADANMYLIDDGDFACFFAGDTALAPNIHTAVVEWLGAQGRRLDVALLPIGHAPWWKPGFRRGHLTSEDALELFHRLDARLFVPYHWGTFNHVTAGAHDAIRVLRVIAPKHPRASDVRIIEPGETLDVAEERRKTPRPAPATTVSPPASASAALEAS